MYIENFKSRQIVIRSILHTLYLANGWFVISIQLHLSGLSSGGIKFFYENNNNKNKKLCDFVIHWFCTLPVCLTHTVRGVQTALPSLGNNN